jgi:hypothetical protein
MHLIIDHLKKQAEAQRAACNAEPSRNDCVGPSAPTLRWREDEGPDCGPELSSEPVVDLPEFRRSA